MPGKARRKCHLHFTGGQAEWRSGQRAARVDSLRKAVGQIRRQKQQIIAKTGSKGVRRSGKHRRAEAGEIQIAGRGRLAVDPRVIAGDRPAPSAEQVVDRSAGLECMRLVLAFKRARAIEIAANIGVGTSGRKRACAGQDKTRARQAEQ